MVIIVGGDGGRRAVRVGTVVALVLVTLGLVLGRYAQVEVLGVETQLAPPAVLLVASEDSETVMLRTTPGERNVPAGELRSGAVVGVVDDHGSWLRVQELSSGMLGWVHADEVRTTAQAFAASPACPVPLFGAVDGVAFAMIRPGAELDLIDGHTGLDGSVWVGVRAEGAPGIGLVRDDVVAVGEPPAVETPCPPIAVDPTVPAHQH